MPGNNNACRVFVGQSISAFPNQAINCIRRNNGLTFREVIQFNFDEGILPADSVELAPTLNYEDEFAIYASFDGHTYFDIFYLDKEFVYWFSFSLVTPFSCDINCVYMGNQEGIHGFLSDVISINLEK